MSLFKPSHVFANLPDTASEMNKMNAFANDENKITEAKIDNRLIQVSSVGVVTLPPDRCRLTIRVTSTKENVADVKESTTRRLDYIIQTLHNHSVKVSLHIVSYTNTESREMYSILIYKARVLLTYDSVFFSLKCQYGDVKNMYQIIETIVLSLTTIELYWCGTSSWPVPFLACALLHHFGIQFYVLIK